jgi:hypothetical protein
MGFHIINNGVIKIKHHDLICFLGENGFKIMHHENGRKQLVRVVENIINSATEGDLITCIKDDLNKKRLFDVLEVFTKGVNTYTTTKKLEFLPTIQCFSDKDTKDHAYFYFNNIAVKITVNSIELVEYSKLEHYIWKNRILKRNFIMPTSSSGNFNEFLFLISKKDPLRHLALKTALGYLSHRYNDPSEPKAVIFIDEEISFDGTANGGTGKSILALALGHCRNLAVIDGQQLKGDSRFKNQRIDITTDIVLMDDVRKNFTLDDLKSMITSGITVEKKGRDEIHISPNDAPKFVISSNYIVLGSGGSTDKRRRCEFEVAKHFNNKYKPVDIFRQLFFSGWNEFQWNSFDLLMMENVQLFLKNGLIEAAPINLLNNKLINFSNPEFKKFSKKEFVIDKWMDKNSLLQKFIDKNPAHKNLSSHLFTKWTREYAKLYDLSYDCKNPGGVQQFILKSNSVQLDTENENEKGQEDLPSL